MSDDKKTLKNKEFIVKYVHPIYQPLLVEILKHRPENIEEFMINWLSNKIGYTPNAPSNDIQQKNTSNEEEQIDNLTRRIDTEDIEFGKDYLDLVVNKALSFYEDFGDDIMNEKKRVSQIADFIPTNFRGSLIVKILSFRTKI